MLRDAANHAQRDDLEILDLAEIVAKSLRPKSPHEAKEEGKTLAPMTLEGNARGGRKRIMLVPDDTKPALKFLLPQFIGYEIRDMNKRRVVLELRDLYTQEPEKSRRVQEQLYALRKGIVG